MRTKIKELSGESNRRRDVSGYLKYNFQHDREMVGRKMPVLLFIQYAIFLDLNTICHPHIVDAILHRRVQVETTEGADRTIRRFLGHLVGIFQQSIGSKYRDGFVGRDGVKVSRRKDNGFLSSLRLFFFSPTQRFFP